MKCEYCGRPCAAGETICSGCGAPIERPMQTTNIDGNTNIEVNVGGVNIKINGNTAGQVHTDSPKETQHAKASSRSKIHDINLNKARLREAEREARERLIAEELKGVRRGRSLYASFTRRAVALWIDVIVVTMLCVLFEVLPDADFLIATCYFILCESVLGGATLGKRAMRIRVVGEDGGKISFLQAVIRYFCRFLSMFIFFIGYFMVIFSKQKQSLHDCIARTYVIRD